MTVTNEPAVRYALGALKPVGNTRTLLTADQHYQLLSIKDLKSKVDLRNDRVFPVKNQKDRGTCVAHAVNEVAQQHEALDTTKLKEFLSPAFIYSLRANQDDPQIEYREGMMLEDAMEIIVNYGVCRETTVPYDSKIETKNQIPPKAFEEAKNHKMRSPAKVWTLEGLLKAICENNAGAIIAFEVYNFTREFWKRQSSSEDVIGRHCVAIVGYEITEIVDGIPEGYFIIKNSWGTEWGDQGYTYCSFDDFRKNAEKEVWTFLDVKGSPPFQNDDHSEPQPNRCIIL